MPWIYTQTVNLPNNLINPKLQNGPNNENDSLVLLCIVQLKAFIIVRENIDMIEETKMKIAIQTCKGRGKVFNSALGFQNEELINYSFEARQIERRINYFTTHTLPSHYGN